MAFSDQIEKLTLGELATVEELGKGPISDLANDEKPKMRMLIALAFVVKKREDPSFTINRAEALTMPELQALTGGDASPEA
jgi:hypothetical protein